MCVHEISQPLISDVSAAIPNNPITFTIVARLWTVIANVRYRNLYGEGASRLDRTIRIYDYCPRPPSIVLRWISILMFKLPDARYRILEVQVVDSIMISNIWTTFVGELEAEWQTTVYRTFALMVYGRALFGICSTLTLL